MFINHAVTAISISENVLLTGSLGDCMLLVFIKGWVFFLFFF